MRESATAFQNGIAERYVVERELGRGGMATVYLACDRKHDRKVALKVLLPELAASLGAERFLREIQLAAGLTHPHILPVYDSGEVDGLLYYVMPFIEGESLRQRLARERRLPPGVAVGIAREVAEALDYSHRRGIVHRDVKPENVLLHDGHALVSDFGIARALSDRGPSPTITATGMFVGTPAYMSPEQAAGDREVDGRSDLYSLGCVLYEMLAGEPPFTGATAQAVIAKRFTQPAPPLRPRADVPSAIEQMVKRLLATAPGDRFQTASEFAQTLAIAVRAAPGRGSALAPGETQAASVAVLPFVNRSSDRENEYFSDGLSEELINALAKVPGLRVASRTSAFAFKGREEDVRRIGEQLGVRTVLEGSVRKAGPKIRIVAELVSTADGYTLWSETYEREMQDVFVVQDEIARAIVGVLKVKLVEKAPALLVDRATENLEAYQLYLKGRYCWNKRTAEGMRQAIGFFQQAIDSDPTYAEAYAGMAASHVLAGHFEHGVEFPRVAMPKAKTAALRALKLDGTLAEAYTALAFVKLNYDWDWAGAEQDLQRAITLKPSYATAYHWYAMLLLSMRREREAMDLIARALDLDPLSFATTWGAAWVCHYAGRLDDAVRLCRKVLEMESTFLKARLQMGQAYAAMGQFDDALAELERATHLSPGSPRTLMALGYAYGAAGRSADAHGILEQLLRRRSEQECVFPDYVASVYAGLGDVDGAFEWLEKAYEERSSRLVVLHLDPMFRLLRREPRFADLLRRVGLPVSAG
jgi:serine/threonine protein kinase/tetratricopeptide (TPR) repeat protein